MWVWYQMWNFQINLMDWYIGYSANFYQGINARGPSWWQVNIGSCNGWLGTIRQHVITWSNVHSDVCRYMTSLGQRILTKQTLIIVQEAWYDLCCWSIGVLYWLPTLKHRFYFIMNILSFIGNGEITLIIVKRPHIMHKSNDDIIKWKYFPRYWPHCAENSPATDHKSLWRRALMLYLI